LLSVLSPTPPPSPLFPYTTLFRSARNLYLGQRIPLAGVAHQNGTIRFGRDPKTSALDANCKAHELDNLYVVDASFIPSSAAVNPDRKSTRLNSSHVAISYAVFCLK